MPIRIDAEVICDRCAAKARCTLDVQTLKTKADFWAVGKAIRGLPNWYYMVDYANVACSAECVAVLARDKMYGGDWKPCQADDVIGIEDVDP
jgi:hypothetical protein